ncbi:ATP-grasp domain-containing protein [Luteolibacter luteus]|uniref:ATP-grasp domain-containing protein n=1 Tax=Luteolibacter luteus TaxID=2728835 RepID=A0A858RLS3_9BACT|nr:ATP-grasp domain-containing protein [Luteolibacter luteus]QJE97675.1 ATP-grasp domain-containing protein [Luteolibacter luteus]
MFEIAYLEDPGNGRLRHEEKLVRSECERLHIPVQIYTAKRIHRRQLPLDPHAFICGDADAMHGAMRQLNIPIPACHDYPAALTSYLKRRTWKSDLGTVETRISGQEAPPTFVKPSGRIKCFTGRVLEQHDDLYLIGNVSRREPVWCSEVVRWLSEYRVYVIGEEIAGLNLYSGDESAKPCLGTIQAALRDYRASGEAPAAYGIDFGVLDTGETALIEANDGYSLGAYQIGAEAYTRLLFTRWAELLKGIAA